MLPSKCLLFLVIWLISAGMFQVLAQTTAKPVPKDEICEGLKNNVGNKLNIWAVGLLHKTLLVVTKDWVVYDVPRTSLDETIHRLYLSDGKPMSEKWPKLWNDEKFRRTKENTMDTMIMIYPDREILCFVYFHYEGTGVDYDMTNDRVNHRGWTQFEDENLVFVSTLTNELFYSTTNIPKRGQGIFINRWIVDGPHHISPNESYRPVCWMNKPNTIIIKHSYQNCDPGKDVQWPMCKGFISHKSFYLFGETSVHVFPQDTYKSHQPRKLTEIGYKDFFMCPGDAHKDAPSSILWLLIALIILLLILLCLILFCITYVYRRRRKRRWRPMQFKSSKSLLSMRSSAAGSNIAVGFLTKVFSSSNKGGGLFSARSSPKTRRSGLKNTPSPKGRLTRTTKTKNKTKTKKKTKRTG